MGWCPNVGVLRMPRCHCSSTFMFNQSVDLKSPHTSRQRPADQTRRSHTLQGVGWEQTVRKEIIQKIQEDFFTLYALDALDEWLLQVDRIHRWAASSRGVIPTRRGRVHRVRVKRTSPTSPVRWASGSNTHCRDCCHPAANIGLHTLWDTFTTVTRT